MQEHNAFQMEGFYLCREQQNRNRILVDGKSTFRWEKAGKIQLLLYSIG